MLTVYQHQVIYRVINSISEIMSKFKIIVCHVHVQVLFTNYSQTHLVGSSLFIIGLIYAVSSFTNNHSLCHNFGY